VEVIDSVECGILNPENGVRLPRQNAPQLRLQARRTRSRAGHQLTPVPRANLPEIAPGE